MDFKLIKDDIIDLKNIYDFITVIFYHLNECYDANLFGTIKEAYKSKRYKDISEQLDVLSQTLLFYLDEDEADFADYLSEWINIFETNAIPVEYYIYETLSLFDNYYQEHTIAIKSNLILQGPLNSKFIDKVMFFNVPPNNLVSDYFEASKITSGRRRIVNNPTDLDSCFKGFHIVFANSLSSYQPRVMMYNKKILSDNKILVGIVPFKVCDYAKTNFHDDTQLLDVEYKKELFEEHKRFIINCLHDLDKQGCNIVIFPELFLFNESIDFLKTSVIDYQYDNIKLIFTGSNWNNHQNQSYIISAQGSILSSSSKKIAYEFFDKKKGKKYTEDLVKNKNINYLDVWGLGRISYLICRDFITNEIHNICIDIMESQFIYVSALSNVTDRMVDYSKTIAKLFGVSTILCNSCSLIDSSEPASDKNAIGFVTTPMVLNKRLYSNEKLINKCSEGNCDCKKCYYIKEILFEI